MERKISDAFLFGCRGNMFNKLTPSRQSGKTQPGYIFLVDIAKKYFAQGEYDEFADFFQEDHYFVALWTAHLLLEYGTPPVRLIDSSLKIIKQYSNNLELAPDVAIEEKMWLAENEEKYRKIIAQSNS